MHYHPGEQLAEGGVVGAFSLPRAVVHDVQQRAERRHGLRDGAVGEVARGGGAHRGDDVFHAVGKDGGVLLFGAEEFLAEEGARVAEDAAAERAHKPIGDAPAEAAREDGLAVVRPVGAALEVTVRDEEFWRAFLGRHAAPEFGDEE